MTRDPSSDPNHSEKLPQRQRACHFGIVGGSSAVVLGGPAAYNQVSLSGRDSMTKAQRAENEAIHDAVLIAASRERKSRPFNLSGEGHEPRVTLDLSLAATLRDIKLPCVSIAGHAAHNYYPLRVFETAVKILKQRLGWSPIGIFQDRAYRC